jgi:hypothetical protein
MLYLVIEEYCFVDPVSFFKIKGKILKRIDPDNEFYEWSVSHYYCPREDAGIYIPSMQSGTDVNSVRNLLLIYMKSFKNIRVVVNDSF